MEGPGWPWRSSQAAVPCWWVFPGARPGPPRQRATVGFPLTAGRPARPATRVPVLCRPDRLPPRPASPPLHMPLPRPMHAHAQPATPQAPHGGSGWTTHKAESRAPQRVSSLPSKQRQHHKWCQFLSSVKLSQKLPTTPAPTADHIQPSIPPTQPKTVCL